MSIRNILVVILCVSCGLNAAWTTQNGEVVALEETATLPPQEHYMAGKKELELGHYRQALRNFNVLALNFPKTTYGQDANYYVGVCQYYLGDFDFANDAFNEYLKSQSNPRFFQETIEYKFDIAEKFRTGTKKHCLGYKQLPKWSSATELAYSIYDEIVVAMPNHDLGVQALYSKANLYWSEKSYREAIETFQMVIRRFPKHELTPESYLNISSIYTDRLKQEFQNPDLLALSRLNLKRFEKDFPKDERVNCARQDVREMEELYAKGLFEMGDYYDRIRKPHAAVIFYQKVIRDFPETKLAAWSRLRIRDINPCILENSENG